MSETDPGVEKITRRGAKSGNVSYGDPVLLHESSRSRVVMIPFFVPRSDGTDLAIKIITYRKADPPQSWVPVEEKSISLTETAARRLLRGLKGHLAVADEGGGDADYLVVPVAGGDARIGEHEPAAVAAALTRILAQPEIAAHLADTELSSELIAVMRGAIRLKELKAAVSALRHELDAGETSEVVYQQWCQEHTWAFGNAYVMTDEVREISPGDHLDLLLPSVISGYRDIVELKRPDMKVLLWDEGHRDFYFSADVSKAIGQCHRYLDVLQEVAANGLRDHPEIVAYHPRAVIVIGRSNEWGGAELRALHGLNSRLKGITVMTYDQLLAQGERLVSVLSDSTLDEDPHEESVSMPTWEDPDEAPW